MTAVTTPSPESAPATGPAPEPSTALRPSLGTARMADGTILRTIHWEAVDEPWAVAEIVHGLGEHGGRYETVAEALTDAGIDTWSYDHRGQRRLRRPAWPRGQLVDPPRRPRRRGCCPLSECVPGPAVGAVRALAGRAGRLRLRPVRAGPPAAGRPRPERTGPGRQPARLAAPDGTRC